MKKSVTHHNTTYTYDTNCIDVIHCKNNKTGKEWDVHRSGTEVLAWADAFSKFAKE